MSDQPPTPDLQQDMAEFARRVTQRQDRRNAAVAAAVEPFQAPTRSFVQHPLSPFQDRKRPSAAPIEQTSSETVTAAGGAFFTLYEQDGHTYLQGGQVKSGSGNFTIADLKVVDGTTGIVGDEDDRLVIEVTVDGYVADGVLLAGLTATAAAYITPHVATVPNDTLPTATSHAGKKVHLEIGRWNATEFLPASSGNFRISFCPGSYTIDRF